MPKRPSLLLSSTAALAITLTFAMSTAGAKEPARKKEAAKLQWVAAGQMGAFRVVTLPKPWEKRTSIYWDALRAACQERTHCNVMFVRADEVAEIRDLPERTQRDRALLVYTTNKGFEWNCEVRPDADNCFSWK